MCQCFLVKMLIVVSVTGNFAIICVRIQMEILGTLKVKFYRSVADPGFPRGGGNP